jgi:hypothetical protein
MEAVMIFWSRKDYVAAAQRAKLEVLHADIKNVSTFNQRQWDKIEQAERDRRERKFRPRGKLHD